jgi:antirestriction protein ArdC
METTTRANFSLGLRVATPGALDAQEEAREISGSSYGALRAREADHAHWTKHPSRIERDFGRKSWGDEGYAREELVAELGAAFLCADLELTPEIREDHAAYIVTWLEVLKNGNRAIFQAAAHAQRAADYLHKLQPETLDAAA